MFSNSLATTGRNRRPILESLSVLQSGSQLTFLHLISKLIMLTGYGKLGVGEGGNYLSLWVMLLGGGGILIASIAF